jgi:hypothetical protein
MPGVLVSPLFRQAAQFRQCLDVAFGDQAESNLAACYFVTMLAQHLESLTNHVEKLSITGRDGD